MDLYKPIASISLIIFFITLLLFFHFKDNERKKIEARMNFFSHWKEEVMASNGGTFWVQREIQKVSRIVGYYQSRIFIEETSVEILGGFESKEQFPAKWTGIYEPLIIDQDSSGEWFIIALCCDANSRYNNDVYPRFFMYDYINTKINTNYIEYRFRYGEWNQFPVRDEFVKEQRAVNLLGNILFKTPKKNSTFSLEAKDSLSSKAARYVCLGEKAPKEIQCK